MQIHTWLPSIYLLPVDEKLGQIFTKLGQFEILPEQKYFNFEVSKFHNRGVILKQYLKF